MFKHVQAVRWLEAGNFGLQKKMKCTITEAKTKATAKLICVFVFAYANCWFSHVAAHFEIHVVIDISCPT